eukprot:COSAG03_NODE_312_length_9111_cov_63.231392_1_plen_50_part_00
MFIQSWCGLDSSIGAGAAGATTLCCAVWIKGMDDWELLEISSTRSTVWN